MRIIDRTNKRCCGLCVFAHKVNKYLFFMFLNVCFQVAGHFRAASCRRRTCFSWFLPVAHAVIMETARCSTVTCALWAARPTKAASVVQPSVSSLLISRDRETLKEHFHPKLINSLNEENFWAFVVDCVVSVWFLWIMIQINPYW